MADNYSTINVPPDLEALTNAQLIRVEALNAAVYATGDTEFEVSARKILELAKKFEPYIKAGAPVIVNHG